MIGTRVRLSHDNGAFHVLRIAIHSISGGIELLAEYKSGSLSLPDGTLVARWPVSVTLPAGSDRGHVWIGSGRIDIEIPELRGIGLGSLFMSTLISWIKTQRNLPVVPIDLSVEDALTVAERDRRNKFYEKFGFAFEYQDEGMWGTSKPIMSHDLLCPEPEFKRGWRAEELE